MKSLTLLFAITLSANATTYAELADVYNNKQLAQLQTGQRVFIGDSITEGWNTTADFPRSLNIGIRGITTSNLVQMLPPKLSAFQSVQAPIHLMIGINDIKTGQFDTLMANLGTLSTQLSPYQVWWSGIMMPIGFSSLHTRQIAVANRRIRQVCYAMPSCTYVAPPVMLAEDYTDGLHPTPAGYAKLVEAQPVR